MKLIAIAFAFHSILSFAGTWNEATFSLKSDSRKVTTYTPDNLRGPRPLLLALHGCLHSVKDFVGLAKLQKLADEKKIYLVLPHQSRLSNPNGCWNWFGEKNLKRNQGEPALIMGMLNEFLAKNAVDTKRIYIMGPSAGGGMTANILATYPEVFAAGMIASGTMHMAADGMFSGVVAAKTGSRNNPVEMAILGHERALELRLHLPQSLPVLVFHGDADSACHPKNSEQAVEEFLKWNELLGNQLRNPQVEELKVPGGYTYTVKSWGEDMKYILVHGMGHGWSGGDDSFWFNFPKGPDQTAIMWDFFREKRKH